MISMPTYLTLDQFLRAAAVDVLGRTSVGMLTIQPRTHPEASGDTKYQFTFNYESREKRTFDEWLAFDKGEAHDAHKILVEQVKHARDALEAYGIQVEGKERLTLNSFDHFNADKASDMLGGRASAFEFCKHKFGEGISGERFSMIDVFEMGLIKHLTDDQILDRIAAYHAKKPAQAL